MAGSLVSRSPTCLACLRRLAQPFANNNVTVNAVALVQVRAKSNRLRPKDQGVVVRLLEDIPKFGRKDSVFRVERGRMRNEWFPQKKAEYMTAQRFKELGMTREDIGERDPAFGTVTAADAMDIPEPEAPMPEVRIVTPEKAHTILTTLVPDTLTFSRKPIPAPTSTPAAKSRTNTISPLVATASAESPTVPDSAGPQAIFGSVSATDIVSHIKGLLVQDAEGSRMVLEPDSIRFVSLEEGADRLKALGRWDVEISIGAGLEPIRKVIEILPLADGASEGTTQPEA
ncbi:hypothetical protein VTK26DRAFT_4763 [Humicola hyalothermophila]